MPVSPYDPFGVEIGPTVGVLQQDNQAVLVGWTDQDTRCATAPTHRQDLITAIAEGLRSLRMPQSFDVVLATDVSAEAADWSAHLADVKARLTEIGAQRLSVVQSCGGRVWSALCAAQPSRATQAAGVVAAAHLGRLAGATRFVSFETRRDHITVGLGGRTPTLVFQQAPAHEGPAVALTRLDQQASDDRLATDLVLFADSHRHPLRESWLIAFGDAGVERACALAERLATPGVLAPAHPAEFAAWGVLWSDVATHADCRFDEPIDAATLDMADLRERFGQLLDEVADQVFREGFDLDNADVERLMDARPVLPDGRAGLAITCPAEWLSDRDWLLRDFHKAHEAQTGARFEDLPVEILGLRVRATVPLFKPPIPEPEEPLLPVEGLPAGWRATRERFGTWRLQPRS